MSSSPRVRPTQAISPRRELWRKGLDQCNSTQNITSPWGTTTNLWVKLLVWPQQLRNLPPDTTAFDCRRVYRSSFMVFHATALRTFNLSASSKLKEKRRLCGLTFMPQNIEMFLKHSNLSVRTTSKKQLKWLRPKENSEKSD